MPRLFSPTSLKGSILVFPTLLRPSVLWPPRFTMTSTLRPMIATMILTKKRTARKWATLITTTTIMMKSPCAACWASKWCLWLAMLLVKSASLWSLTNYWASGLASERSSKRWFCQAWCVPLLPTSTFLPWAGSSSHSRPVPTSWSLAHIC